MCDELREKRERGGCMLGRFQSDGWHLKRAGREDIMGKGQQEDDSINGVRVLVGLRMLQVGTEGGNWKEWMES